MTQRHILPILLGIGASTAGVNGCTERGQVLKGAIPSQPADDAHSSDGSVADSSIADARAPASRHASSVSVGIDHACAVESGVAACWGANDNGQLGTQDGQAHLTPTAVVSNELWASISAGYRHTCANTQAGRVFCWGQNDRGQLGQGDRDTRDAPVWVDLPGKATTLDTHFAHSCAILEDASLFCWGSNNEGELGQGDGFPGNGSTAADALSPVRVGSNTYAGVSVGDGHTCGVSTAGALFCWGRNSAHELGSSGAQQVRSPTRVEGGEPWQLAAAGQNHSCGLRLNGSVWCWGANSGLDMAEGAPLGLPGEMETSEPTLVQTSGIWLTLSTDTFHTCAVNQAAELWCWGRNIEGQLGLGDTPLLQAPTLVGQGYAAVDTGRFATCALTSAGAVVCAGENERGQLGTGTTDNASIFREIQP